MKTAAIYARVSTEEQVKNTSLKGQLDACREHAKTKGYVIIKEIAEDFSGARLDRPGLDELRSLAVRGEIQALVVYEPDRLSRKVGHLLLLEEELVRYGASLIFVSGQDDTTSPEGRMFFTMRGAFGEFERTKIIERMRLGKLRLARSGRIIGNRCQPLGYRLVNGQYEIIEKEARIVRWIFERVAYDQLTLRQAGIRLTEMGVTTKQGNARWLPNSIKAILDNRTYAGVFLWNKTMPVLPKKRRTESDKPRKVEKTSKKCRDESEWIAVPCPSIVSEELFEAAHRQLQTNKERSPRNTRRNYLLRGLMKCGLCGFGMYGRSTGGRLYYYCGGKNNRDIYRASYTGQLCPQHHIRGERLEVRIWDYIKSQVTDEEKLLATFERRGKAQEEELRRDQGELESLYSAEAKLKGEQNKMLDLYSQDIITLEQLQERLTGIRKKQESVNETKTEITARMERRGTTTATAKGLREYCKLVRAGLERAESNTTGVDYRRKFLEMLETRLVVDEKHVHISGIITGKLPLFDIEEGPGVCLLGTASGYRVRGYDTAAGCGR